MRRPLYIPRAVISDIRDVLKDKIQNTVVEAESAFEDEDTLTGHLGARLTTRARRVSVIDDEVNGSWSWSLKYTKFRGRGPGATEKYVGADGIFELTLDGLGRTETKSILFQSKVEDSGGKRFIEQCAKLSTWREAAFIINFCADAILATTIDQALATRGDLKRADSTPLDVFLSERFVPCLVGDNDLHYIPKTRILVWDSLHSGRVSVDFSVKHRFSIKVKPPSRDIWVGKAITADNIHLHRMNATARELLSRDATVSIENPKKAQRALNQIYHPDLWRGFSPELQETMKTRTQEINDAFDQLKK